MQFNKHGKVTCTSFARYIEKKLNNVQQDTAVLQKYNGNFDKYV